MSLKLRVSTILELCKFNIHCLTFIVIHQVTQVVESRIKKMTETYTSGVAALKELADTLQIKASSDLEQMKSTVLLQVTAVENV